MKIFLNNKTRSNSSKLFSKVLCFLNKFSSNFEIAKNQKGLTIIEVLIAITLFSTITFISSSVFISVVEMEKKTNFQNAIYNDAQLILSIITNEIQNGTIDYEEYFSQEVIQYKEDVRYYGLNYGAYASRFYFPGETLGGGATSNPENLGTECSYENPDTGECELEFLLSKDWNTGANSYLGSTASPADADVFCDNGRGKKCGQLNKNEVTELYLINGSGNEKTIIAKRSGKTINDGLLAMMKMEGLDMDQNGVIDTWRCKDEYTCIENGATNTVYELVKRSFITNSDVESNDIRLPQSADLDTTIAADLSNFNSIQFAPISPMRSSLVDLKFIINPIEDPFRAYSENDVQNHPTVTIIMTIGLSEEEAEDYPGDFQNITIQSTVATGLNQEIVSYPPSDDMSWLDSSLVESVVSL